MYRLFTQLFLPILCHIQKLLKVLKETSFTFRTFWSNGLCGYDRSFYIWHCDLWCRKLIFFFNQYILFYSELGIMSNIPIQWEMLKTTVASVSASLISQLCSVTQEIKTCFWLPLVCLFFSPKICPFSSQKKKINAIQLWKPGRGLAFSDQEN